VLTFNKLYDDDADDDDVLLVQAIYCRPTASSYRATTSKSTKVLWRENPLTFEKANRSTRS